MKKQIIILLVIVVLAFVAFNGLAYYYLVIKDKPALNFDAADTTYAPADTLGDVPHQLEQIGQLRGMIDSTMKPKGIQELSQSPLKLDWMRKRMLSKVDIISRQGEKISVNIDSLKNSSFQKDEKITAGNSKIEELLSEIEKMKKRQADELQASIDKKREANYDYLAQSYSQMNPKKAASYLAPLEDDDREAVLKRIDPKKRAKIMEELAPYRGQ